MENQIPERDFKESGVYMISLIDDPFCAYVGSAQSLFRRYREHRNSMLRLAHWNKRLQEQFNNDNLVFRVLALCKKEHLLELEQVILNESRFRYDLMNINRYSFHTRRGIKASAELKERLSRIHKGKPSPIKGIPRTSAHRKAIKEGLSKLTSTQNKERYRKISEGRSKTWAKRRDVIVGRRLTNKPQCKWVIQCDLNGNEIKRFHGIKYAAEELKIQKTSISACIRGLRKTCGNFIWKLV